MGYLINMNIIMLSLFINGQLDSNDNKQWKILDFMYLALHLSILSVPMSTLQSEGVTAAYADKPELGLKSSSLR